MRLAVHNPLLSESARSLQLFDTGALIKLGMRLSGSGADGTLLRPAGLTILIGWVPLFVLTLVQHALGNEAGARSFLSDVAVSARSLIAAPLLVIAMQTCLPRLTEIARTFRDSGILATRDLGRFDYACASTLRLSNFLAVDIIIVALVYAIVFQAVLLVPTSALPPWYAAPPGFGRFSLVAWWYAIVSLPVLLALIFEWIWRVVIWARFLYLVSLMDLRLVPAHPDRTAGLKFVGYSAQAFAPVALAFGFIVAGWAANQILYRGAQIQSLQYSVIGLVAFVLLLFAGPLSVFFPHLLRAWRQGIFEYGSLAAELGRRFESKWFRRDQPVDMSALEAPDFSATTDLYQIASNVYEVRLFPTGLTSLGILVAMTVAPFGAIAAMFVPMDVIVSQLVALIS